jgi:(p)ppGpp synthase/HD superfamily hydrolase
MIIGDNMDRLQLAIYTAIHAHKNQKDKGGQAYINHPMYVALSMNTTDEKIVALLHDVIEDNKDYKIENILNMYGEVITEAVDAITKREDEKYKDYLIRVKANDLARKVKRADLIHNLRGDRGFDIGLDLRKRYQKSLEFLMEDNENEI